MMRYLVCLLVACSSSPSGLDPTGEWQMTLTWQSGACAMTGTTAETVDVYSDCSGGACQYETQPTTAGGLEDVGSVTVSSDDVMLSDVIQMADGASGTITINAVAMEGTIQGTALLAGPLSCQQSALVTGQVMP
jgi:hypothetical protein